MELAEPDAGLAPELDAGPVEFDAGQVDAGFQMDAGPEVDAGSDAGVRGDAGLAPDAGPILEPDSGAASECTVVPQSGCQAGEACRAQQAGPPKCEPAGPIGEHEDAYCFGEGDRDLCQAELFCAPAQSGYPISCRRPCDPYGDPCPDFWSTERARWLKQECVAWNEQVFSCLIAR